MKALATLWLVLLFTACSDITGPVNQVSGATRIPTTAQYRSWWSHLETCSGLSGNIDAVRFYSADSISGQAVGLTVMGDGPTRVYLVSLFVADSLVVQHEMMHALLQRPGHPAQYFNGPCGDLRGGGSL
jgi:hypothetical protein